MSTTDDSFNSNGATVVAFETINTDGMPSFGVSAIGTTCGVYGQGTTAFRNRRIAPSGTGVFGRGEAQGVYGISEDIGEADTPDVGSSWPVPRIGVLGVTVAGSPAVLGNNGTIGSDFNDSAVVEDVVQTPTGVTGITRRGPGVLGISMSSLAPHPRALPVIQGAEFTDHSNVADAGLVGLSLDGPGVRAVSWSNRGGVFEAGRAGEKIMAQIRLFPAEPSRLQSAEEVSPPTDIGEAGDLLALNFSDPNKRIRASLWFCTAGVHDEGNAVWVRLA